MAGYEITAASNSSQPLSSSRKRFERFRDVVRLFLSEGNFSNSIRNESNESRNGGKLWERNYFQCGESFFRGWGGTHAHTCGYTKKFLIIEHDHVDTTRATRFPWQRAFCARGFLRGLITRRNFITNTEGGGGEEGEVDQAACSFRSNTFHTTWDTRGGEAKWRSRRLISLGKRGIWESGWLVNLSKNSHQLLPTLFSERVEIETETLPLLSLFFLSFYISSSIEYLLRGKRKGNSITTRVFVFVAIEETQIDGQLGYGEDTSRWMIKTISSLQLVASFLTKTSGKDPRRRGEQISRFDSTSSNESVHEAQRGQSRVYEFVTGRNWHKLESQFLPAIWGRKKNVILYSFQRCYSSFVIRDQTLRKFLFTLLQFKFRYLFDFAAAAKMRTMLEKDRRRRLLLKKTKFSMLDASLWRARRGEKGRRSITITRWGAGIS